MISIIPIYLEIQEHRVKCSNLNIAYTRKAWSRHVPHTVQVVQGYKKSNEVIQPLCNCLEISNFCSILCPKKEGGGGAGNLDAAHEISFL